MNACFARLTLNLILKKDIGINNAGKTFHATNGYLIN